MHDQVFSVATADRVTVRWPQSDHSTQKITTIEDLIDHELQLDMP
ncbi:MAG: hypothetical protein SFV81_18095 [Pirellulaceae bacterium]|nr:hypothetical protein [Pirellulaceae bacterium]